MVTDLEADHRRPYMTSMTTLQSTSVFSAWHRSSGLVRGLAMAAVVASGWALSVGASSAHARDVYWSVGVDSPGVSVGVSNAPPPRVVVRPRPVFVERAPVVVYPGYRQPRPVYVGPPPAIYVEDHGYREYRHDRYRDDRRDHYRDDRHSRRDDSRRLRHERWLEQQERDRGDRGHRRDGRHGD